MSSLWWSSLERTRSKCDPLGMPNHELTGTAYSEAPPGDKSRDEMMAEFRAEMRANRQKRVVKNYTASPAKKDTKPEDYPWMKPDWKW